MMKRYPSLVYQIALLLCLFFLQLRSDAQVTMYLDSIKNVCLNDSSVTVQLRTKKFKGILEVQGAIKWNPSILKFSSFNFDNYNPLQLDSTMLSVDSLNGYILLAWFAPNIIVPQSVVDTSVLLSIKFKVTSAGSGNTLVQFTSYPAVSNAIAPPLPSQIVDSTLKVRTDTLFVPGYLSFLMPPMVVQEGTSLSAIASGFPTGYQWNLAGAPVVGETNATYSNPTSVGGSYTVTAYYADGCVETSGAIALPITLLNFNGENKEGKVQLTWTSGVEINADYYSIERSMDGKNFVAINKVKAYNRKAGANYLFTDNTGSIGDKAYYRLKLADKNGYNSYSSVISISGIPSNALSIFPNPVRDNLSLQIHNKKAETVVVTITDLTDRVIIQQTTPLTAGANTVHINVSTLSKGTYVIVVKGESQLQQKFMKY